MDISEIPKYLVEGVRWLTIGGGAGALILTGTTIIIDRFSEKIKSQEDLEKTVNEESKKLGLNKKISEIHLDDEFGFTHATKFDDETYGITVCKTLASKNDVRHELYHIHKNHFKEEKIGLKKMLKYILMYEPQAVAYGTFGLKI